MEVICLYVWRRYLFDFQWDYLFYGHTIMQGVKIETSLDDDACLWIMTRVWFLHDTITKESM